MNWLDIQILLFMILISFAIIEMQFIPLNLQAKGYHLYGIKSRVIAKNKKLNDEYKVNILTFITTTLFVLVLTAFLLIIYVKMVGQSY